MAQALVARVRGRQETGVELGSGDQSRIRDLKNPGKAVAVVGEAVTVVSLVSTAAVSEQGPTHGGMTPYPSVQANWNGVEISQMSSHFYFTALFHHLLGGTILCSQEAFRLDSCAPSCCCKKKHIPPFHACLQTRKKASPYFLYTFSVRT